MPNCIKRTNKIVFNNERMNNDKIKKLTSILSLLWGDSKTNKFVKKQMKL